VHQYAGTVSSASLYLSRPLSSSSSLHSEPILALDRNPRRSSSLLSAGAGSFILCSKVCAFGGNSENISGKSEPTAVATTDNIGTATVEDIRAATYSMECESIVDNRTTHLQGSSEKCSSSSSSGSLQKQGLLGKLLAASSPCPASASSVFPTKAQLPLPMQMIQNSTHYSLPNKG
jgi:hypothetical protein